MTARKALGGLMLATPFIGLAAFLALAFGWRAPLMLASGAALVAWIVVGVELWIQE